MKKHTSIYMDGIGYTIGDFIPSEISGAEAKDIHHIRPRGMGGTKTEDTISNLMALTREEHILFGDKKQWIQFLEVVHESFLLTNIPYIDLNPLHEAFDYLIESYPEYKTDIETRRRKYLKDQEYLINDRPY